VGALLVLLIPTLAMATDSSAATSETAKDAPESSHDLRTALGYLAAALAVGLGSIGAGLAVAPTASAAIGAVAEKEEMAGKALVFVGLAEGIAIYGLVISIMILSKL